MKMQQALFQQQEFMVKQQAILQETFAQLINNMQGSILPVLPPLPTLPNFNFVSLPTFQSCILPSCLKIMNLTISSSRASSFLSRDKAPITMW